MPDNTHTDSHAPGLLGRPAKMVAEPSRQVSANRSIATVHGPNAHNASPLLRVWLVFLPLTSVVIVPSVQGTTPANIFALLSVIPVLDRLLVDAPAQRRHLRTLTCVFALLISIAVSQLALSMSHLTPVDFAHVQLASTASGFYLRPSLLTQSAYLIVGFITFAFFWTHYRPDWDRFLLSGALLLATYGFVEVAYSASTGRTGDFLSNRSFMEGSFSGSLVQFHSLLGPSMMRLKSLTGEPSMYAITIAPYAMLAIHRGRMWVAMFLVVSMLLTVSTTAYLGLMMILAFACFHYGRERAWAIMVEAFVACAVATLAFLLFKEQLVDLIHRVVVTKFTDESASGTIRSFQVTSAFRLWTEGTILTQLFGVGFGFVRSADLATTLIVNVGVVGLIAWSVLFGVPLVRRIRRPHHDDWAAWASGITLVLMLLAVPEFAYPVTWAFLGIAYQHTFADRAGVRPQEAHDPIKNGAELRTNRSRERRSAFH